MTALTENRNTPARAGEKFNYDVAAATTIYAGSLVCLNSSGYAVPGSTATTLTAVGRALEKVDNSSGSAGDKSVEVDAGVFRFGNSSSTDEISISEIGAVCYVVDDQTVAKTSGTNTRSRAGIVVDVDDVGVWVRTGLSMLTDPSGALAAANNLSDLANAATARSNLGVNTRELEISQIDLVGANTEVYRRVLSGSGTISKITSVLNGALTTGDATITAAIDGSAVTGGVITAAASGSAAGDIDTATPSAANTFTDGQILTLTVGGSNDAEVTADIRVDVTF